MRRVILGSHRYRKREDIEKALAAAGLYVAPDERLALYVPVERIVPLGQLWLFSNPARSKRSFACLLRRELAVEGIQYSVNQLQKALAGKLCRKVRREVKEKLLELLARHGLSSERTALRYYRSVKDKIGRRQKNQTFVFSRRFRQLFWLWKIGHREPSSRRLLDRLEKKIFDEGVCLRRRSLHRLLNGDSTRVRRGVVSALQGLLRQDFPHMTNLEEEVAKLTPQRVVDLSWVKAEPIAALAREWVAEHPGQTMRQLAIRVSKTARRMGYRTTHNTVQCVLGGHKKKSRGFVYRALILQFRDKRRRPIPSEHIIKRPNILGGGVAIIKVTPRSGSPGRRIEQSRSRRKVTLESYLEEARSYLPFARSPHFLPFVTFRAARLYGIPRREAETLILGRQFPATEVALERS